VIVIGIVLGMTEARPANSNTPFSGRDCAAPARMSPVVLLHTVSLEHVPYQQPLRKLRARISALMHQARWVSGGLEKRKKITALPAPFGANLQTAVQRFRFSPTSKLQSNPIEALVQASCGDFIQFPFSLHHFQYFYMLIIIFIGFISYFWFLA